MAAVIEQPGFTSDKFDSEEDEIMAERFQAPAIGLKTLDGKSVTIGGRQDRPQIINFWASWCPPCRAEFPELEEFYADHKDEIYFFAISQDEDLESAEEFVEDRAENYDALPILFDAGHLAGESYEIEYLPTTLVVDTNGMVRATMVGGITRSKLEATLASLN